MGEVDTVPGACSHLTALREPAAVNKHGQIPFSPCLFGLGQAMSITNRFNPIWGC